jgi:hypothetical protein
LLNLSTLTFRFAMFFGLILTASTALRTWWDFSYDRD